MQVRRVSSLLLALALLVGAAGAACGDDDKGAKDGSASSSEDGDGNGTTDTSFGPGGPGTDAAGVPTTRPPSASGGTSTTSKVNANVGRQRQPGVAAPGRYLYNLGTDGSGRKALDVYEGPGQPADETLQIETWTDKDSADRFIVRWRKDAKLVEREQSATPDENGQLAPGDLCEWSTAYPHYQLPLAVGKSWTATASCAQGKDGRDKRDRKVTVKVTSTDTISTVEGEPVPVVVLERVVEDTQALSGVPLVTRTTTTEFVSTSLGIPVRITGTVVKTFTLKQSTAEIRLDLRSTKPTPLPE